MNKKSNKKRILRIQVNCFYFSIDKNHHVWEVNQCEPNDDLDDHGVPWWLGAAKTLHCTLLPVLPGSTDGELPHYHPHHHWPASPITHVILPKEFVPDWYLLHLCHSPEIHHELSEHQPFHLLCGMCLTGLPCLFFNKEKNDRKQSFP